MATVSESGLTPWFNPERAWFEAGFKRSQKGNLWRLWEQLTLSVYRDPVSGGYGWSIRDGETGPRFSKQRWDTEAEALLDLWWAVVELEATGS
jgi:hypothetical protein